MSKDTCIKANTYCPVHKGIVGADCWHDSKDFSVPRTDWKQVDEINTLREQVEFWQKEAAGRRDDMANYTRIVSETIDRLNVEVSKLTKERKDAERFRFMLDDHAEKTTRQRVRELFERLPVMSLSAARAAIDRLEANNG